MIDWDRIAELQMEVGEDGLSELMEIFFDEFQETFDGMVASAETFHFLKGMASNIGMNTVTTLCSEAEMAMKKDGDAQIDLSSIAHAFQEAKGELREAFG